ncbi:MAG: hypothetical protein K8I00_12710, partial [Candidatus Omnitrophica bacterium]|nr:hypothetical protein [Candidatus Omnitrophota bacterium]
MATEQGFTCQGEWWLPNCEKKVAGVLKYDRLNGTTLSLCQRLDTSMPFDPEIILGFADGHLVTLLCCFE